MTYRYATYDILNILKQNFDDKQFSAYQVLFWILAYANRLKSQHIQKIESGAFLHTYPQILVQKDTTTARKYVELPALIYDLDMDDGVNYMSYDYTVDGCVPAFTSVNFQRTSPIASKRLYFTEEEKPAPGNPYFYRVGNRLYLLGIECIDVAYVEAGLVSAYNPATICDLDEDMNFPDELYPILQRQILDIGRFGLAIPNEFVNDAANDLEQQITKQKLISVNDLQQQQQTEQV